MILGLLSDTHGRGALAARALRVLRAAGAEVCVHCGDIGAGVLEELAGGPAWFVWGNADESEPSLPAQARALGLTPPAGVPLRLELAGRSLAVFHGHEPEFARLLQLVEAGQTARLEATLGGAEIVLFGHTHAPCDQRIGSLRLINPGALYRTRTPSVATLDLNSNTLRFWRLDPDGNSPRSHSPP